ncbi:MAG: DUF4339 domain-containing protein [Bdellovibrionales bacterium]|nr:DUF4339 domain-containing protein [Bdellovibrionales bacterium]
MSASQFFVSHEGNQMGPFPISTIVEMVKKSELTILDYLYDETKDDWVLLMEHPELARVLKDQKPASPPKSEARIESESTELADDSKTSPAFEQTIDKTQNSFNYFAIEWYILKGENKFGPFSYADIIRMLQQKVAYEFDFVWHAGLNTWQRIADLDAFKPEHISQIHQSALPEMTEVFFRRRHRRVRFGGTILIHDNKNVWRGTGVEISSGGAGVVMENASIVPGQILYLHFKPGDGVPPFNATCEVVSKQYVEGVADQKTPIRYGLKFTSISPVAQSLLQDYAKRNEVA